MLFPPNKSRFCVGLYNEELQYKIMSQNATFHGRKTCFNLQKTSVDKVDVDETNNKTCITQKKIYG